MDSKPERSVVFEFLSLTVFSDGSYSRAPFDPAPLPASSAFGDGVQVATKDLILNHSLGTYARLFLPARTSSSKLPLLLYFHGGGFCCGSTALPPYHGFLSKLAAHAQTLIVSVDYRLAPEHRLPAAYDDCFHTVLWLHQQTELLQSCSNSADPVHPDQQIEPWLAAHADFSKLFLAGDSAGANIAHHVALRFADRSWEHLLLQGMILIHPFFSGEARTDYESRSPPMVEAVAHLLKLSLPDGANQDHPFSNPMAPGAPSLEEASLPRTMVAVASEDGLYERGIAYYQALLQAGKRANLFISESEGHVFHLLTPNSENVQPFLEELGVFLNSSV